MEQSLTPFRPSVYVHLPLLKFALSSRLADDVHIRFGRVEGMSTRKGQVVFLKDILDEAQHRVLDTMKEKDSE